MLLLLLLRLRGVVPFDHPHRALLRQLNRFNHSVELALAELHARNEALAAELRRVAGQP